MKKKTAWLIVGATLTVLAASAALPENTTPTTSESRDYDGAWQVLPRLARDEKPKRESLEERAVEETGVELAPWYSVGPFRDTLVGLDFPHLGGALSLARTSASAITVSSRAAI